MTKRPHACQASQYGDQIICHACGFNWDANDQEPPACSKIDRRTVRAKAVDRFEAEQAPATPKAPRLPHELPADVAFDMIRAYQANSGGVPGMQAAYRLFLDRIEPC